MNESIHLNKLLPFNLVVRHTHTQFVSVACKILTTNEQEKATTTKEFVFLHRFNLLMNMAIFFHLLLMIILNETRGKKMSKQSIK